MSHNVCLLGGGTRLAAHLGVLNALQEQSVRIEAWAGASAGSLIAAVMAAGHTLEQAAELMFNTDYRQFFEVRPAALWRGYGLCSGRRFEKWLDKALGKQRFADLNVALSVVATDVDSGEPYIFSPWTTPEVRLATAVRCSIGIPGVFSLRKFKGNRLIDGSLVTVQPSVLFPFPEAESILVRLQRNRTSTSTVIRKRRGLASYVRRVAGLVLDATEDLYSPEHWARVISIQTGRHSPINFSINHIDRQELYRMGYQQAVRFLNNSADEFSAMHTDRNFSETADIGCVSDREVQTA